MSNASKAALIETLAPQSPDVAKDVPIAGKSYVDQGMVDAWMNAGAALAESTTALFLACIVRQVAPSQFVGRKDAKVRASEFNTAHKAAKLIGSPAARKMIEAAKGKGGDTRANILAAMRTSIAAGKKVTGSALRGAALQKEIAKSADAAMNEAADKQRARLASARLPRAPKAPAPNTLHGYAPIACAALIAIQKDAAKVSDVKSKLGDWKAFNEALAETILLAQALS